MINKNKKGQIQGLTGSILALVVAIIVLVMGIVIIQEIRDSDIIDQSESSSFINETVTTVTEVGDNLVCNTNPASICSITTATNATGGEIIGSVNFTVSGCTLSASSIDIYNNTNWNVTYSCTFGGETFTSANTSLVGLGNFSDFIPIIVIAVAASLIISLILVGFAFKRRER